VPVWGFQSLASCLAIRSPLPRSAMRISTAIRYVRRPRLLQAILPQPWVKRRCILAPRKLVQGSSATVLRVHRGNRKIRRLTNSEQNSEA
jgi:hypothetical protein